MEGCTKTQKKLLLIINPRAGTRRANRYLTDIVALFNSCGYETLVYTTAHAADAGRIAAEHAAGQDLVVCVGGDGTLNEVVGGMLQSGQNKPIGYIAAGSTNDFAASMGLSTNILRAAQDIMEGTPRRLDAGRFNGRCFSYVASCGAFTEASYTTPQPAKNALGHLAYILEGMKDLPNIRPIPMRVVADQKTMFESDYIFGAVSNSTSIGGIMTMDKALVSMDDGLFELTFVKMPVDAIELGRIMYSIQTQDYDPELFHRCTAKRVDIYSSGRSSWTLDGEYAAGSEHIVIENLHHAFSLVVNQKK